MQRCLENITYNERELTYPIFNLLKNTPILELQSGELIQILNSGYLNKYAGPDIKDISYLKNGEIITGDAEIDIKASFWNQHGHSSDQNFDKVRLHIVTEVNYQTNLDTILVDPKNLKVKRPKKDFNKITSVELQDYAAKRLKRKSLEFGSQDLKSSWEDSLRLFLISYSKKRKRPTRNQLDLELLFDSRFDNYYFSFFKNNLELKDHYQNLDFLLDLNVVSGSQLNCEILINCVLPVALSKFKFPYQLWLWYWGVEARSKYGFIKNQFPEYSQKYVWQQQGMLEYIYEQKN